MTILGDAIAEDAESLAALHDRELSADMIAALRDAGFPSWLGRLPHDREAVAGWRAMAEAVAAIPAAPDSRTFDDLAAEYAAIYLTGAHGASPCESVWTDDDHLTCQTAMFQMREIYAAAGLAAADWRQRPDDHLVPQLLYVAHAARRAAGADEWRRLADVLDEHLLRWLPDFAARVAARSGSAFYVALAVLTASWGNACRHALAIHLGEPRPTPEEIETRLRGNAVRQTEIAAYLPGAGPSW